MEVHMLQARDETLLNVLNEGFGWAKTVYIAVAYGSNEAFQLIQKNVETFLRKNGRLRVLFDLNQRLTDRQVVEEFATIPGDCTCKIYITPSYTSTHGLFHPKFYLFHDDEKYYAVIGSSNFTLGGFRRNIEVNIGICGVHDDVFAQLATYFQDVWTNTYSLAALENGSLLEAYERIRRQTEEVREQTGPDMIPHEETLREEVDYATAPITDEGCAFILGLVCADGGYDRSIRRLTVRLRRGPVGQGTPDEGYYHEPRVSDYRIQQLEAHQRDTERIVERLEEIVRKAGDGDIVSAEHVKG